jgi:hypothetical protein
MALEYIDGLFGEDNNYEVFLVPDTKDCRILSKGSDVLTVSFKEGTYRTRLDTVDWSRGGIHHAGNPKETTKRGAIDAVDKYLGISNKGRES